jgi:hypothetical protein
MVLPRKWQRYKLAGQSAMHSVTHEDDYDREVEHQWVLDWATREVARATSRVASF